MYWKLEWSWECDDFTDSDVAYFETEEDIFLETRAIYQYYFSYYLLPFLLFFSQ